MGVPSNMQIIANADIVLQRSTERLSSGFDAVSLSSADSICQQSFSYFMTCALGTYAHALPGVTPLEEIYRHTRRS